MLFCWLWENVCGSGARYEVTDKVESPPGRGGALDPCLGVGVLLRV